MLVCEDAPRPLPRPRLALGQPTTRRWSMERDLSAVADCGFDAVGLWNGKFRSRSRREVAKAVRRSGVSVSSLSWIGGFTHGDEFDRRQAWFEAAEAIKLAGEVGAKCVCVATGGNGCFTERHASHNLIPGTLRKLGAMAAEFDVSIAVQPLPGRLVRDSVVRSVSDTLKLLDRVGRPNVGMALPTLLMARNPSLVNRVHEFAHAVKLVKLADCRVRAGRGERRGQGQYPGNGSLPLTTLIHRLAECGYTGDYELDVWNRPAWEREDHTESLRRTVRWFADLHDEVH
ncbi:sugar phosphate isomerase/epimerase family protein [Alienimonas sp. DA493]|uniref:sugar phosphate isomerase/epimerase family protein n=1 Tax=Alienimonas sp. DA493 TaxID=3373605 RepID=UPI0037550F34